MVPFYVSKSYLLTIREDKSGLSVGFFFRHLSTKSRILSEKIFFGNFGGGWFTIYSNNSKIAIGLVPGDLGVFGVLGLGEIKLSSNTWAPNSCTWVEASGGGIGYIPKLISNKDRPSDHKSLATEYWEPWKKDNKTIYCTRVTDSSCLIRRLSDGCPGNRVSQ